MEPLGGDGEETAHVWIQSRGFFFGRVEVLRVATALQQPSPQLRNGELERRKQFS